MRRVIAISLAILVVTIAARGVVAQDTQQDGNDLLLKILKERNVLTDSEYQEIKGQIAQEQSAVDQKLTALDRSLADYLAKAGDVSAGNTTYVQNQGVTFGSGDGMWSVYFGGLFQFGYAYWSGDDLDPNGGFGLDENRIDFGGTIFDPALSFYVQLDAKSNVQLLDAYINWAICDFAFLRAGEFKVPFGRQFIVDQSDRSFGRLNSIYGTLPVAGLSLSGAGSTDIPLSAGRDQGVMFHDVTDIDDNVDGMKIEWAVGLWNGGGGNRTIVNETWLMWGLRLGFYPMGFIPYVEGDWDVSQNPKFGIAGSYFSDSTQANSAGKNPNRSRWELDAVLCWAGLYFTAEYHSLTADKVATGSKDLTDTGWFAQAGYFIMPRELEVLLKYSMLSDDPGNEISEIALGVAYYFNGHEWKILAEVGQITDSPKGGKDSDNRFFRLVLQADW
jgi:hypothetical protein